MSGPAYGSHTIENIHPMPKISIRRTTIVSSIKDVSVKYVFAHATKTNLDFTGTGTTGQQTRLSLVAPQKKKIGKKLSRFHVLIANGSWQRMKNERLNRMFRGNLHIFTTDYRMYVYDEKYFTIMSRFFNFRLNR